MNWSKYFRAHIPSLSTLGRLKVTNRQRHITGLFTHPSYAGDAAGRLGLRRTAGSQPQVRNRRFATAVWLTPFVRLTPPTFCQPWKPTVCLSLASTPARKAYSQGKTPWEIAW
jgi:hypothetical protein